MFDKVMTHSEIEEELDDFFFASARVSTGRTGLPYELWICSNQCFEKPLVYIDTKDVIIPVVIDSDPDVVKSCVPNIVPHIEKVIEYVAAYSSVLIAHCYKHIDDLDALRLLRTQRHASEANMFINKNKLVD